MRVVNLRKEPYTVYIGRPSILGNPYKVGIVYSREESINNYRDYLWKKLQDKNSPQYKAITSLQENDVLGCYCKPLACHGDIIIGAWEWLTK